MVWGFECTKRRKNIENREKKLEKKLEKDLGTKSQGPRKKN